MGPETFLTVAQVKERRVAVDAIIQMMCKHAEAKDANAPLNKDFDYDLYSRAQYQATNALIEAKMWLGKMLEGLGNPFPPELADKAANV